MSRRRMLGGAAAVMAGGVSGSILTRSLVSETAASEADLSVAGDEVEVRNEELAAVWLDIVAEWAYDVPSGEDPDEVRVTALAGPSADGREPVGRETSDEAFLEADGELVITGDLLDTDVFEAEDLRPDGGGETTDTEVSIAVEFELLDEDGLVIAADSATDTATVAISKSDYDPEEYGSVAAAGELTVEVE